MVNHSTDMNQQHQSFCRQNCYVYVERHMSCQTTNVIDLLLQHLLIMAALHSRYRHYIFALWFLSIFFPRLISAATDWMSTILRHVVWP